MSLQNVQGTSMFTKNSKIKKQCEYLTNDLETEVIIVGGGVTGSIVGYYFSKVNIPAVILEKERIAHCSTSITTSLLQYELDSNARELEEFITMDNIVTKSVNSFDGWFNKALIRDNCSIYNYFRTTKDNRIIAGGEDMDFYNNVLNEKIAKEKYEILLNRIKSMFLNISPII